MAFLFKKCVMSHICDYLFELGRKTFHAYHVNNYQITFLINVVGQMIDKWLHVLKVIKS
jgi:hypothetical protein